MKVKKITSLILAFAMIFSFVPYHSTTASAVESDLTVKNVFTGGQTESLFTTGDAYNIDIDARTSTYSEPIIEIIVPKNIAVTNYPTSADATIGPSLLPQGVTKSTDSEGNTIIKYSIKPNITSLGFNVTLNPTHKLEDATSYTTIVNLYDGKTLSATKVSTITTNNPTLKVGSVCPYYYTSETAEKYDGQPAYIPIKLYLNSYGYNHYSYDYVKTAVSIPQNATPVFKNGNTYTECVSGSEIALQDGTATYYDNYEGKGKVLLYYFTKDHYFTKYANYLSIDSSSIGNIYLKYDSDTAVGTYTAPYSTKVAVGLDGSEFVMTDWKNVVVGTTDYRIYVTNVLKNYTISDYFYTFYSVNSKHSVSWTYTPLDGYSTNGYVTPMENEVKISSTAVNNTGEKLKNINIKYNIPKELYVNNLIFNLGSGNIYAPTRATVTYKTQNGGEATTVASLTSDDYKIILADKTDSITYMEVNYDKLDSSVSRITLWEAYLVNKDSVEKTVNATTQITSAQGTVAISNVLEQAVVSSIWNLESKYYNQSTCNYLVYSNKISNSISVSKDDSFGISLYTGQSMPLNNATFSVLVPSEYIFEGVKPYKGMENATYDYSNREIIIAADKATPQVPEGKYILHTIHYNDGVDYEGFQYNNSTYWTGIEFWFKIGPLVDTSSLKTGLKVPVVFMANSGNDYFDYYQTSQTDIYDLDGDNTTTDNINVINTGNQMSINAARAIVAKGFLTSNYAPGEKPTQEYKYNSTGSYKLYLYNGLAKGNSISDASIEIVLPRDENSFTSEGTSYRSEWNAILTGKPVLTGDFWTSGVSTGSAIMYKHGDADYTTAVPASESEFATVTQIKIISPEGASMTDAQSAIIEIPIKADFEDDITSISNAYMAANVSYKLNGNSAIPVTIPSTLVPAPVVISGNIFKDYNCDGIINSDESNVIKPYAVTLYKGTEVSDVNKISTVSTNYVGSNTGTGAYSFSILQPGKYTIKVEKDNTEYYPTLGTDLFDENGCYTFTVGYGSIDILINVNLGIVVPRAMNLNSNSFVVYEGSSRKIVPTIIPTLSGQEKLSFVSSDTNVVTVSEDGTLTYVGEGSATVTVSCPQSAMLTAIDNTLAQTITKNVHVSCKKLGCHVTGKPFVSMSSSSQVDAITILEIPYNSVDVTKNLYYFYNRNANGYCTEEHLDTKNVNWSIVSDTGANASIESNGNSSFKAVSLKVTSDANTEHIVVLKAEEVWTHDVANKPEPIIITVKVGKESISAYNLSVNLDGGNGNTVGGSYTAGQVININAGSKDNYDFGGWVSSNGGVFGNTKSSSTTFTMPAKDTQISATWVYKQPTPTEDDDTDNKNKAEPVIVDGIKYEIGTQIINGNTTIITVDQNKFMQNIDKAKIDGEVIIPISNKTNVVAAQLLVQNIEDMAKKEITLMVKSGNVSYNIPTESIDIEQIKSVLGNDDTSKMPISIQIKSSSGDIEKSVQAIADSNGFEVIVKPIEFTLIATYNGKKVEIEKFDRYVERRIEITKEQASKITTAIVTENDGTIRHIPTYVFTEQGKWYANVNSRTNSIYTLIYNDEKFADAQGTWYEETVNEMASRKIINGKSEKIFAGNDDITRAEFAAIVVRALGLSTNSSKASRFTDVESDKWYYGAVGEAYEYGIIKGKNIEQTLFDPMAKITRQEAMTMIERAAKLKEFGVLSKLSNNSFTDIKSVSDWAIESVEFNLNNGLIVGSNNQIRPNENISRAETATVILRLLQKSKLVDIRTNL